MFEIAMIIAAIVLMVKVADAENRSGLLWGCATRGIAFVSLFLPWPYLRVFLAAVVAFAAMMVVNMVQRG
jgi:hypothetical protein